MISRVARNVYLLAAAGFLSVSSVCAHIDMYKASFNPKHPTLTRYNGGKNEISTVMFGSLQEDGSVQYVRSKPKLMETLVPIRHTISLADANIIIDRKFYGYREPIGQTLASAVQFLDLMPEREYLGVPFVDEYNLGITAWWVFNNTDQLRGVTTYLKKHFAKHNLQPAAQKPTLVIDIADEKTGATEKDLAWVSTYFNVVDLSEPAMKELCVKFQEAFTFAKGLIDHPRKASQPLGEIFFGAIEKQFEDFKTNNVIALAIKAVALSIVGSQIKKVIEILFEKSSAEKDAAKAKVQAMFAEPKSWINDHRPSTGTVLKVAGGAVAAILLYNVINKHVIQANKNAEKGQLPEDVQEEDTELAEQVA